ncbi:hypothetical protein TNIN_64491 [Trichonephila inaurata madagascariensis]|uniref:Uncharacterized protein n=1 Tax=Trichonephila inaurata madagascariensis TaxID=2747483 RepID=A0A8X6YJ13_9ARAC|nr:hypothetical protein TNIN_64491 [Trichonephila inaurata madagascariensis]
MRGGAIFESSRQYRTIGNELPSILSSEQFSPTTMVSSNLISRFPPHRQNNRSKSVGKQAIHSTNTPFEISTKQQYPGKTVEVILNAFKNRTRRDNEGLLENEMYSS